MNSRYQSKLKTNKSIDIDQVGKVWILFSYMDKKVKEITHLDYEFKIKVEKLLSWYYRTKYDQCTLHGFKMQSNHLLDFTSTSWNGFGSTTH